MPAPLVVGAMILGSLGLSAAVTASKNLNKGIERDTAKDIPSSALTPSVDTRAIRRDTEMIQHEIANKPGMRVRVNATIDSDDALSQMQSLAGQGPNMFDERSPFDDGVVDGMLASRMR